MQPLDLRVALFSGNYNYVRDGANQALNLLVGHLLSRGAEVRVYSPTTKRPAFAPTGDLVIDGLAVTDTRQGTGRALIEAGALVAARDGRPGLRAEVRARNRGALAFYDRVGFSDRGRGRYGLPWWGQVHLLHLSV